MGFIILSNVFLMFAWYQQQFRNANPNNDLVMYYCFFNLAFGFVILFLGFQMFGVAYILYFALGLIASTLIFFQIERKLVGTDDPAHARMTQFGFFAIPLTAFLILTN